MHMYLESDNRILLSGVYNQLTSAYVNNATVTLKIYSALAQEVGDQIGTDISLAYVAASNGNYAGYIGHAVIASAGYPLILKIIVVVGDYQLVVKVAVDGAYANLGNT